jgi:hypothetical protein
VDSSQGGGPQRTPSVPPAIPRHCPTLFRNRSSGSFNNTQASRCWVPYSPPPPAHGVEHVIEATGRPVFAHARHPHPARQRIAEAEFREVKKVGIIRRSDSPWASPLHMVPKKDGSWWPCRDYRHLNMQTKPDRYPLPNMQDMSAHLHGCTVFSKIDLVKGYHQVPVSPSDIPKTAINTPFGLFEYLRMPFGLTNAAQTFQHLMDHLFGHLSFVFVFLDNLLVASRSDEEHLDHLRQIFEILASNGLAINIEKCVFAATSLEVLGYSISATGVAPLPFHVTAIRDFPQPGDVKGLQRFLGMCNFYRRFIPGVPSTMAPLTAALAGNPLKLSWCLLSSRRKRHWPLQFHSPTRPLEPCSP